MVDPVRLFVVAGEPSGDRIGADLLKRIRVLRPVAPVGVGGPELEGEGLRSLFPMHDLAVMGVNDVLRRLPLLLWRIRQTARAVLAQQPDVVVLIDSQVFSQMVARQLRKAGYKGPVLLYVAPAVWAWKPERAPALRPLYDEVLSVLPFEPAVMQRLGGPPTSYVGHPAIEHSALRSSQPERGPLLLLPGSRAGELRRHLGIMQAVATAFRRHERITGFVLPTPRYLEQQVTEAVAAWGVPVYVTTSGAAKQAAFADAIAAVAVTGTVTLELAVAGVPTVATYVGDSGQMKRLRKYKGGFVALPNILYGSALVPEIIDDKPHPDTVIEELERLLSDPDAMATQRAGFERIRRGMATGTVEAPVTDAAERVLAHLR